MPFTAKILADGQMATGAASLMYTVPSLTVTYVKSIRIHNRGASSETIRLYVRPNAGTDRVIARAVLDGLETLVLDDSDVMLLSAGATIRGDTSTATTVDFLITGIEES